MNINCVSLSGNLTRDMEVRTTQSGMAVGSFGIAVNDRRKNAQGQWEDYANWISCTIFGSRAESLERYLSKGTHVALSGKLRYSQWERDGQKRSKVDVVVTDIDFTAKKADSRPPSEPDEGMFDDDIPF